MRGAAALCLVCSAAFGAPLDPGTAEALFRRQVLAELAAQRAALEEVRAQNARLMRESAELRLLVVTGRGPVDPAPAP